MRRKEQEQNVKKKNQTPEEEGPDDTENDNIDWYKKEVGEEPQEDEKQYLKSDKRKKTKFNPIYRKKKRKIEDSNTPQKKENKPNKKRRLK